MAKLTIEQLKKYKESEDKVEFKKAEQGNFAYDGGSWTPNKKTSSFNDRSISG